MMRPDPNNTSPRHEAARLNERAAQTAANVSRLLCRQTIELVYEGVDIYLQADREQTQRLTIAGYPEGELTERYVTQQRFVAPRKDGQFVRTFATRLEPLTAGAQQYMKLYVPVGRLTLNSYRMPDIDEVDEVYLERGDGEDKHWYAVSQTGMYEYIPLQKQAEGDEILSDQGIWRWIEERVPETLQTVSGLMTDIGNWDTVLQRVGQIDTPQVDPDL